MLVEVLRPRVDAQRTPTRLVDPADRELQLDRALVRQRQGSREHQLLHHPRAKLAARMQRQLQERDARQQHRALHRVVGEPRMRRQRQAPREQPAAIVSQPDGSAQQRVIGRRLADPGKIRGAGRRVEQKRSRWNA